MEEEEEEYHILSIDGGGSRGVMEAFLLQVNRRGYQLCVAAGLFFF